ncbi:MAG: N-6 DNA methylase [Beijerinckiaceae bacterium]|nr:N-6 DNA methylase [Beijerinckiaceae bacterium]
MSRLAIDKYLNNLEDLKRASGAARESVVREAFKDLLKDYARTRDLIFLAEYDLPKQDGKPRYVDGALVYDLRLPFGYWEAKDEADDLDEEIAAKFRRGYPRDNIIFEDSSKAVLIQNGNEVMRCPVQDVDRLEHLLGLFFGYERQEIADFRKAVVQFQTDLPAVLKALREMIDTASADNGPFRKASAKFLKHAKETINPSVTAEDVREMLIQHILTEEIFSKVFDNDDFHRHNNVAKELYALEGLFFKSDLKRNTMRGLEPYYNAIRATAHQIKSHSEKQTFLKVIYEGFYKVYNKKAADRLGVVYTPQEIVRFMIESADWLCQKHFGKALIDRDVEILDPATGTGTFICELLEHFRGQKTKLAHKYKEELHANEVAILPYYVANLNIEATYAAIMGQYADYPNLCFVDTLDNVAGLGIRSGHQHDLFGALSEENVERIKRQNRRKISVVIGNPPYNANQQNENDNNKNRTYPKIDQRIKDTYIKQSTAQKTKAYDMYTRFFRWASDRLHDDGILAFVTNRSFIDSRTMDGFRKAVAAEYSDVYVVDLGGDVRANPKLSGTKNNVFGIQTGVAISFLVKRKRKTDEKHECRIHYVRRPEMETAEEKLEWLGQAELAQLDMETVRPDAKANWINQTKNNWDQLTPVADAATKRTVSKTQERAVFKLTSLGASTNRDAWVIGETPADLLNKVTYFHDRYEKSLKTPGNIPEELKSSRNLVRRHRSGLRSKTGERFVQKTMYRPYVSRYIHDSPIYIDERGSWSATFADAKVNYCIAALKGERQPFSILATDQVPNLNLYSADPAVYLPRYRYTSDNVRIDNITDWALNKFVAHYGKYGALPSPVATGEGGPAQRGRMRAAGLDTGGKVDAEAPSSVRLRLTPSPAKREKEGARRSPGEKPKREITKDAIFHYVYAVLHDPLYREKYAQNLKREFPRIPFYPHFWRWADWGERLMALHIGYESVEPWPLVRTDAPDEKSRNAKLPPKTILRSDHETGIIVLDSETQLSGVPASAWTYRLGNRTALDWILDQHKEKTPKDPTIREKFNTYRFADHKEKVVDLLTRVTRVSVETMEIVEAMKGEARG